MKSAAFIGLVLSLFSAEGSRVALHEHSTANWGRSCESLQTRFGDQSTRLAELEGMRSMVASISILRTLRRANARECDWVQDGNLDTSAIEELAAHGLQQGPCYSEYQAAIQAAHDLPEEEQISAANDAIVLLFSEDCSAGTPEPPELDTSDEEMEEEMDDTTDDVMEQLVQSSESSLIQQPLSVGTAALIWTVGGWSFALSSLPLFIGAVLGAILFGLLCNLLGHTLVRIFRYIRCKMFGSSCSEYAPATWARALIGVGCGITGVAAGPFTGLLGFSVLSR
jgi:hypothetical protein